MNMLPVFSIDKIQRKISTEQNLARLRSVSKALETVRIARPKPIEVQDQEEFDPQDIKWSGLIFAKNERPRILGRGNREFFVDDDFPIVKEITLNTSWEYRFSPRFEDKDKKRKKYWNYDPAMDKSNWLLIDRMLSEYENIFQIKTGILPTMVSLTDMKFEARGDYDFRHGFAEVPVDQIIFADQKSGHGFPYAIRGIKGGTVPTDWKITINRDLPVKQWRIDSNDIRDKEGDFLRLFEQNPVVFIYQLYGGPLNTSNFKVNSVTVEFY